MVNGDLAAIFSTCLEDAEAARRGLRSGESPGRVESWELGHGVLGETGTWLSYPQVLERRLRALGVRKEDARFVLPNATTTRIIVTMNLRSLRHLFEVRCDKAAQWEIRALALEMLRQVHELAPAVFQDLYDLFLVGKS